MRHWKKSVDSTNQIKQIHLGLVVKTTPAIRSGHPCLTNGGIIVISLNRRWSRGPSLMAAIDIIIEQSNCHYPIRPGLE